MMGRTHATIGVTTFTCIYLKMNIDFDTSLLVAGVIGSAIGSYLPDIDCETSYFGRSVKIISSVLEHRGITHTFVIPIIIFILYKSTNNVGLYSIILGWVLHIIADLFNSKGVPIFYPFIKKKLHIGTIKTGSHFEYLFLVSWLLVLIIIYIGW